MYFVDRKEIDDHLIHMARCIETFEQQKDWTSRIETFALERIAHVTIEAMIDVGQIMIDGFVMRDAGGYTDIIDILCDERVLQDGDGDLLKALVGERRKLVRSYISIDHEHLCRVFAKSLPALKKFPQSVRDYLVSELGPVSAFIPEGEQDQS